ncbi:MAG: hypothetical protein M0037_01475 [Betaproteobacteria bacterium]|nr:hypothetical protein [Betaproteobacteria bacterium]
MASIAHEGEICYAKPLARALLRDGRLTFGARGLFAFLWDLPRGWRVTVAHLVNMGPEGRDAIRSRIDELQKIGAMRIEEIRKDDGSGHIVGTRWILVTPDRWAVEWPLKALADADSTELRVSRNSVIPKLGDSETRLTRTSGKPTLRVSKGKGSPRVEGSPNTTTPPPKDVDAQPSRVPDGGGGVDSGMVDDLVEAAIWGARMAGAIRNEPGLRRTVRKRVESRPSADDLATLAAWRSWKVGQAAQDLPPGRWRGEDGAEIKIPQDGDIITILPPGSDRFNPRSVPRAVFARALAAGSVRLVERLA